MYYGVFGKPGPYVAEWLRNGGWRLSHVTDWQAPPPSLAGSAWMAYARRVSGYANVPAFVYQPRLWTTTTGLACLAGEPGSCVATLVPRARVDADTLWRRRVVSALGANEMVFRLPRGRSPLGPSEGWLLSEMVRTLGKERFGAFWRSDRPLEDAFRGATSQSLDGWVHDWSVRTYGPFATGPGLSTADALFGVVLTVIALVGAMGIARARRVS